MPLRILKTMIKSPTLENKHKYYALHMLKELLKINDKSFRQACDVMIFPRLIELAVCPLRDRVLLVYNKRSDEAYSRRFYRLLLECMKVWCESFGAANPRFVYVSQEMHRTRVYPAELRLYDKLDIAPISGFDHLEGDMRQTRRKFFAEVMNPSAGGSAAALGRLFDAYGLVVRKAASLESVLSLMTAANPVSGRFSLDKALYTEAFGQMEALRAGEIAIDRCRDNILRLVLHRQTPGAPVSLQGLCCSDILFFSPKRRSAPGSPPRRSCPAAPEKDRVLHLNARAAPKKAKKRREKFKTENTLRGFRIKDLKSLGRMRNSPQSKASETTLKAFSNIQTANSVISATNVNKDLYDTFSRTCREMSVVS